MARSDWAAFMTEPAAEYLARTELERFGLGPYLPQIRKRFFVNNRCVLRQYPLFPRYFFLPIQQIHDPAIRACRYRITLLKSQTGTWRASDKTVRQLQHDESAGLFDESNPRPGQRVTIQTGALHVPATVAANLAPNLLELLSPLLGGARVIIDARRVRTA